MEGTFLGALSELNLEAYWDKIRHEMQVFNI